jgi:hypothetical protein
MDLEMDFSCRRSRRGRGLGRFSPGDWVNLKKLAIILKIIALRKCEVAKDFCLK